MYAVWLLLAVFAGGLIAVQSRLNGELAHGMHDPYAAALISFGSGLVVIAAGLLIAGARRAGRRGAAEGPERTGPGAVVRAVREGRMMWWQVLGGCGGALLVLSQALTVTALGVALFTVAVVAGQTAAGLAVDRKGLGPAGPQSLTAPRIIGSVLVLAAVGVSTAGKLSADFPLWMLALPLMAGACVSWQQAVNGHVRVATGSAPIATFTNFAVGATVLATVFAVHSVVVHPPRAFAADWYVYCGGPIGIVVIGIAIAAVHQLGVLILGLATITGQLLGSLALNTAFPRAGAEVTASTFVGIAVALVAIAIAALPRRRGRGSRTVATGTPNATAAPSTAAQSSASRSAATEPRARR
ncbi:DMT family transporter [Streptomyces coffeae]|uniref:DMT family transporter n=1 Tax=Streptomyces coffeae TaxID=621382 RepID=A0ABS1NBZ8_9ACTN|nr:DMT family transporter [Streptomyces coffeae]MBL1097610.1 DMT family transporter [Streptomyces coffeae]